jgi:hypothetical protein
MFIEMLKDQLSKAQNRMKVFADQKCTERSFQVGEHVLLKLQPYAQRSVVNKAFPKLAFKYFGSYEVLEKIGLAAYKLQLLASSAIHHVFHVSQLKAFTPDHSPIFSSLLDVPALDVLEVVPERILDRRLVKKGNVAVTQILVQWSGRSNRKQPGRITIFSGLSFHQHELGGKLDLQWGAMSPPTMAPAVQAWLDYK